MPLFGKSRSSSANPQPSTTSQPTNGFQSSLRGPKPPTTGPTASSAAYGSSQSTPYGQGPNMSYPRKSSRSPSSFFPVLPRKTTTQNPASHGTSQLPPSASQSQPAAFTAQPTKTTTSSRNVPILETRATDTSRPPNTSTWRDWFSRSTPRDKSQSGAATPPTARPSSSRVPSTDSVGAGSNMARQHAPENRVFESVRETKSSALRPSYASSGSKSSLTSGSVPSLLSDITPKSTMRSRERFDGSSTVTPTSTTVAATSQALVPPPREQPLPPPPPPSAASDAFSTSNRKQAVSSATIHQQRGVAPRSGNHAPITNSSRAVAQSSPNYEAARSSQSPSRPLAISATASVGAMKAVESADRGKRTGSSERIIEKLTAITLPAPPPSSAALRPGTTVDITSRAKNTSAAENATTISVWNSSKDTRVVPTSRPSLDVTASKPAPTSRALALTQPPPRHRRDSWLSPMQVITSHKVDEDDPEHDLDDLLTPSSLESAGAWDSVAIPSHPSSKPAVISASRRLEAAPPEVTEMPLTLARKEPSTSLVLVGAGNRQRADSSDSSTASSSISSELIITNSMALVPGKGNRTAVLSPTSSAFPPMITREARVDAAPVIRQIAHSPDGILHKQASVFEGQDDDEERDLKALVHREQPSVEDVPLRQHKPPTQKPFAITSAAEDTPHFNSKATVVEYVGSSAPTKTTDVAADKLHALIQQVDDAAGDRPPPVPIKDGRSSERVNNSRAVVPTSSALRSRAQEAPAEITRPPNAMARRPSYDAGAVAQRNSQTSVSLRSLKNSSQVDVSSSSAPPVSSKAALRLAESTTAPSQIVQTIPRRSSREVVTVEASPPRHAPLTSPSQTSLDRIEQAITGRTSPYANHVPRSSERVNEVNGTGRALVRRTSREVVIEARAPVRSSSDERVPKRVTRIASTSNIQNSDLVKTTPKAAEPGVKEVPSKPPVVRRPSRDRPTEKALEVSPASAAVPPPEKRVLAQRAPRRLSIHVPKSAPLNAILSPVSSDASQALIINVEPPSATSPPPAIMRHKAIKLGPAESQTESAVVPVPATPSVLAAPPPTPQGDLTLARARGTTNSKPSTRPTARTEHRALPPVNPDDESKNSLQLSTNAATRARSPSPLAQELAGSSTEGALVVAPGSISRSGLQIDALTSALSMSDKPVSTETKSLVPVSSRTRAHPTPSQLVSKHDSKPPTSSSRNETTTQSSRKRIESTPPRMSSTAESSLSPVPVKSRSHDAAARSNTLDEFTTRLQEASYHIKPPLRIAANEPPVNQPMSEPKKEAPVEQHASGLSSTRPRDERQSRNEQRPMREAPPARSSSEQTLSSSRKVRTPSPTNEPVTIVRRHPVPVLIPPPPDPRPGQASSPPLGLSESSSASESLSYTTAPSRPPTASRSNRTRLNTMPTPASSSDSIPAVVPPQPLVSITTTTAPPTTRVWKSRRSGAPSALNAVSPSLSTQSPTTFSRAPGSYVTNQIATPQPGEIKPRERDVSLPSSSSPPWGFYPSYANYSARDARLAKAQKDFEEEKNSDFVPVEVRPAPQPFTALNIPASKKNSPFAFLSRSRHVRTLSMTSLDAVEGSQAMGSIGDAASRRSVFSDFTPPPSPGPIENVIGQWHDTLAGQKKGKPGVTWDLDTGSPVAKVTQLMKFEPQTDTEESV